VEEKTEVVVMDLVPVQADVVEFVKAGVSGFILKDAALDDFLHTIRSVAQGAKVLPYFTVKKSSSGGVWNFRRRYS
jgi:DNA-binding NarL/FixJ family response regulator